MKALKALEKPLGVFLYPLKSLKKAVGNFLLNRWKRWKKPFGFFPLPVESAEKSRWEKLLGKFVLSVKGFLAAMTASSMII